MRGPTLAVVALLGLVAASACRRAPPAERESPAIGPAADQSTPAARCRGAVPKSASVPRELAWPRRAAITLTTDGGFTADAPDAQNWMNAPPDQKRPPPLAVDAAWLGALDCALEPALRAAAGGAKLEVRAAGAAAAPLTSGDDDQLFDVRVHVGGSDDVGGHYGGLTVRVDVASLQRPRDFASGHARFEAPRAPSGAAVDALGPLLSKALAAAFDDLHRHLGEDAKKPAAELTLVVPTEGLPPAARAAAEALVPCAVGLGASLGHEKLPSADGALRYRVRYRLQKDDPAETEAGYLTKYAGWLGDVCAHGKCRCSTWRTGLDGYTSERHVDPAKKEIVLRFRRPTP